MASKGWTVVELMQGKPCQFSLQVILHFTVTEFLVGLMCADIFRARKSVSFTVGFDCGFLTVMLFGWGSFRSCMYTFQMDVLLQNRCLI